MAETILFFLHSAAVLIFGVLLSAAFADLKLTPKNILSLLGLCTISGLLQLTLLILVSEKSVWCLYPLLAHLPTVLLITFVYRKKLLCSVFSLLSAYLLCQPPKWLGIFAYQLTQNVSIEYVARIVALILVGIFAIKFAAPCLSGIFKKDAKSILIFGIVPTVYYLFDYIAVVYTSFWHEQNLIVTEFLSMLICITYMIFCMVYYREYEQKKDAERKEQIFSIVAQQQAVHIQKVKEVEQDLRMVRHDMRHLLDLLATCIDAHDLDKAKELLQSYSRHIDGTQLTHFCQCDTVNYVLSAFSAHCEEHNISLHCNIQLEELNKDEFAFCAILQNALDNAFNAQLLLPQEQRNIHLLLKMLDNKLLLSVKNPVLEEPIFADGLPIATEPGHGYGTQNIRYLSEQEGGSCQFSVRDGMFTLRVVL